MGKRAAVERGRTGWNQNTDFRVWHWMSAAGERGDTDEGFQEKGTLVKTCLYNVTVSTVVVFLKM